MDQWLRRLARLSGAVLPDPAPLAGGPAPAEAIHGDEGGHERPGPAADGQQGPRPDVHADRRIQQLRNLHGEEDRDHVWRVYRPSALQPESPEVTGREKSQ